jgi:hypothetical protein
MAFIIDQLGLSNPFASPIGQLIGESVQLIFLQQLN